MAETGDTHGGNADQRPDFLIVAPVLDEVRALPALLAELTTLELLEHTVFVDNGSADAGPCVILRAGGDVMRERRRGYGYPCLAGVREARARGAFAVVFMEADGTDDPAQVRHLVGPVLAGAADLVLGSRRQAVRGRAAGHMPLHQRLGNAWLALNLRLFFGLRLSDDAPFRAIRLDLLERLALEERAYAFPTEMTAKARLAGARVAVRDVAYRPRLGPSKIAGSWRASLSAVRDITWCLVRLRLFGFRGQPANTPAGAAGDSLEPAARQARESARPDPERRRAAPPRA